MKSSPIKQVGRHWRFVRLWSVLILTTSQIAVVLAQDFQKPFGWSRDLYEAVKAVGEGGGNAAQKALVFANNKAINLTALNGDIPNKIYQANQRTFDLKNAELVQTAAQEAGLEAHTQVKPAKPGESPPPSQPGTDTDIIVGKGAGQKGPITATQVAKAKTAYESEVSKYLKDQLGTKAPPEGSVNTDTDFMPKPSDTTAAEFTKINKAINKAGGTAYESPGAAETEANLRTGQKINPKQAGEYVAEMNRLADHKLQHANELEVQARQAEVRGDTGVANRMRSEAQLAKSQAAKYVERIDNCTQKILEQHKVAAPENSAKKSGQPEALEKPAAGQKIAAGEKVVPGGKAPPKGTPAPGSKVSPSGPPTAGEGQAPSENAITKINSKGEGQGRGAQTKMEADLVGVTGKKAAGNSTQKFTEAMAAIAKKNPELAAEAQKAIAQQLKNMPPAQQGQAIEAIEKAGGSKVAQGAVKETKNLPSSESAGTGESSGKGSGSEPAGKGESKVAQGSGEAAPVTKGKSTTGEGSGGEVAAEKPSMPETLGGEVPANKPGAPEGSGGKVAANKPNAPETPGGEFPASKPGAPEGSGGKVAANKPSVPETPGGEVPVSKAGTAGESSPGKPGGAGKPADSFFEPATKATVIPVAFLGLDLFGRLETIVKTGAPSPNEKPAAGPTSLSDTLYGMAMGIKNTVVNAPETASKTASLIYNNSATDAQREEAGKQLGGFAGGMTLGYFGAKLGASLGLFAGPAGSLAAGVAGGLVGLATGFVSYYVGDKIGNVVGGVAQKVATKTVSFIEENSVKNIINGDTATINSYYDGFVKKGFSPEQATQACKIVAEGNSGEVHQKVQAIFNEVKAAQAAANESTSLKGLEASNTGPVPEGKSWIGSLLGVFSTAKSEKAAENTKAGGTLMQNNTTVQSASTAGDVQVQQAQQTINSASGDALNTAAQSTAQTAASQNQNSMGNTLINALVQSITVGGASMGNALGAGAAGNVAGALFGSPGGGPPTPGAVNQSGYQALAGGAATSGAKAGKGTKAGENGGDSGGLTIIADSAGGYSEKKTGGGKTAKSGTAAPQGTPGGGAKPTGPYAAAIAKYGTPTGYLGDGRPYWGKGDKNSPYTDHGIPPPSMAQTAATKTTVNNTGGGKSGVVVIPRCTKCGSPLYNSGPCDVCARAAAAEAALRNAGKNQKDFYDKLNTGLNSMGADGVRPKSKGPSPAVSPGIPSGNQPEAASMPGGLF